jgi:hypothetical protein
MAESDREMKLYLVLAGLLASSPLWAGTDGTTGAEWLDIPTDARVAALAGAGGALLGGVESLGLNSAGLADIQGTQLLLTQDFWAQGISEEHLGVGQKLSEDSGAGFSFDYLGFGSVDTYSIGTNGVPVAQGTLSPNAMNLTAGYGWAAMPALSVGGELKLLLENLSGTMGSSVAADLGALYDLKDAGVKLGLMVNNVGTNLNQAALPTQVSLAAAWQTDLQKAVKGDDGQTLSVMTQGDLETADMGLSTLEVGSEYWYDHLLALRAGFRLAPYGNLSGLSGLTLGAGFRYQKMELSYAFVSLGEFGASNQISLIFGF